MKLNANSIEKNYCINEELPHMEPQLQCGLVLLLFKKVDEEKDLNLTKYRLDIALHTKNRNTLII